MARISEETIQKVAEATDIVDLIMGYFPLKKAGTTWKALCPFHNEKTASFTVNPVRQTYHCFGCGAGGNVFRFLMEYEHVDFVEAVRRLAARARVPIIEEIGSPAEEKKRDLKRRILALQKEAESWFHLNLTRSSGADPARTYLKNRGISSEIAKRWAIGYAPDSWDEMIAHLKGKGYTIAEILASGLVSRKEESEKSRPYARFRDRIMFPIHNEVGETVAFSGRTLNPDARGAKYVNSPETPVFRKGQILFGLDKTKRDLVAERTAIVLEGQIDLIMAYEHGIRNVIAPQGTAFTSDQARILARFVDTVVLCFDSDSAGQEATTRSVPPLLEHGIEVHVARLPPGSDPDSMIRDSGPESLLHILTAAPNFFDHAITRIEESGARTDPQKLSRAVHRLSELISSISDPIAREATAGRVSARLGVAPGHLLQRKPRPRPLRTEMPDSPVEHPIELCATVQILCRQTIQSPEAKSWLAAQSALPLHEMGGGYELLQALLESPADLSEPSALNALAASLPHPQELALHQLDLSRRSENPLDVVMDTYNGIRSQSLKRQLQILETRLREDNLSPREASKIHQERFEIHQQLAQLKGSAV